jgi:hypothetical protein
MRSYAWDVLATIGLVLVCWGLWLQPAAALIVGGGGLIGVAVLGAKRWASLHR